MFRFSKTCERPFYFMTLLKGVGDVALPDCELYDPSKGTWTFTHHLHHSRGFHQASLLANGLVLITGGGTDMGLSAVNSIEWYDPSKHNWTLGEHMHGKRWAHTATVLKNGNVLVTGGIYTDEDDQTATNTTELYNSSTTTWLFNGILNKLH